jgi:pimeloyl-ACP methyl ester carboxylesterase
MGLFSQTCRVIAPDLPGYGESARPGVDYTIEYYTDFLNHFVQDLGLNEFSLVGLSLGGHIAASFTLQFPSTAEKLILVSSAGLGTRWRWRTLARLMVKMPTFYDTVRKIAVRSRPAIRCSLRNLVHDPQVITEELVTEISQSIATSGGGQAWSSYVEHEMDWSGFRNNLLNRLAEITSPTLIVHGSNDRLIPVKWAKKAHQLIPDSQLSVFEKCGHWPPREKPIEFTGAVLKFLFQDVEDARITVSPYGPV